MFVEDKLKNKLKKCARVKYHTILIQVQVSRVPLSTAQHLCSCYSSSNYTNLLSPQYRQ